MLGVAGISMLMRGLPERSADGRGNDDADKKSITDLSSLRPFSV